MEGWKIKNFSIKLDRNLHSLKLKEFRNLRFFINIYFLFTPFAETNSALIDIHIQPGTIEKDEISSHVRVVSEESDYDSWVNYFSSILPIGCAYLSKEGDWKSHARIWKGWIDLKVAKEDGVEAVFQKLKNEIEKVIQEKSPLLEKLSKERVPFFHFYFFKGKKLLQLSSISILYKNFEQIVEKILKFNKKIKDVFGRTLLKRKIKSMETTELDFLPPHLESQMKARSYQDTLFVPLLFIERFDFINSFEDLKRDLLKFSKKSYHKWIRYYEF